MYYRDEYEKNRARRVLAARATAMRMAIKGRQDRLSLDEVAWFLRSYADVDPARLWQQAQEQFWPRAPRRRR